MEKSSNIIRYKAGRTLWKCGSYLITVTVAFAVLLVAVVLFVFNLPEYGVIVSVCGVIVITVAIIIAIFYKRRYYITVTNGEIVFQRENTAGQWEVKDIKKYYVDQSFLKRLLRYGDVYLRIEKNDYDVVFQNICNPQELVSALKYYSNE